MAKPLWWVTYPRSPKSEPEHTPQPMLGFSVKAVALEEPSGQLTYSAEILLYGQTVWTFEKANARYLYNDLDEFASYSMRCFAQHLARLLSSPTSETDQAT